MPSTQIKCLHVLPGLGQGGAEMMLFKLLSHIDRNQFQSMVVSMTDEGVYADRIRQLGIRVECLHMDPGVPSLRGLLRYRRIVKAFRPDLVQAWIYHANLFAFVGKFISPRHRLLFNIREGLPNLNKESKVKRLSIKLNAMFSKFVSAVINNSESSINEHQVIGFSEKKWAYIPNGFDLDRFRPDSLIYNAFREERGWCLDTKVVGFFARFVPVKNHHGFFEAMFHLKKTYGSNFKLVLAGTGVDHSNKVLVTEIEKHNLRDHVYLLGSVDPAAYMPALDVLACPSHSEGFANVLGEAMACGLPCVVTNVGDSQSVIGDCGYAVEKGDMVTFADRVYKLLSLDPPSKKGISVKCRARVKERYAIAAVCQQYQNLYRQTLGQ